MWFIGARGLVAQIQMDRSLFSSAGDSAILPSVRVDYSLGEFMIGFHETEHIILQEGFYQGSNNEFSTSRKDLDYLKISIQAFPNPSSSIVNIATKGDDLIQLMINNHLGELMHQVKCKRGARSISVDMHDLTRGIYFARIFTTKVSEGTTVKLIRQ